MSDRHCARGNHWRPIGAFSSPSSRDCIDCAKAARLQTIKRAAAQQRADDREFPGVDIDQIYLTRGLMTYGELAEARRKTIARSKRSVVG